MTDQLAMNEDQLLEYLHEVFPQAKDYQLTVEAVTKENIRIAMPINGDQLRPGGTISGPTMFALADVSAYLLILAHLGKVALAVTTNLNINFLKKPPLADLYATACLLKLGKRLAVVDIHIFSKHEDILVAHATSTYSIPPISK